MKVPSDEQIDKLRDRKREALARHGLGSPEHELLSRKLNDLLTKRRKVEGR